MWIRSSLSRVLKSRTYSKSLRRPAKNSLVLKSILKSSYGRPVMLRRTPVERAVATYCPDWQVVPADKPGICKVNPETLNGATPADLVFRYIDISSVTKGDIDWKSVQSLRFADAPSRARR